MGNVKFKKRGEYSKFIEELVENATGMFLDEFAEYCGYPRVTVDFLRLEWGAFSDKYRNAMANYERKAPHTQIGRTAEDEISSVVYRGWILEDVIKYANAEWGHAFIKYSAGDMERDCLSTKIRTHDEDLSICGHHIEILYKDTCAIDKNDYAVVLSDNKAKRLIEDNSFIIQFGKSESGGAAAVCYWLNDFCRVRKLPAGYNGSTTGKGYNVMYYMPHDLCVWDCKSYNDLKDIFRRKGVANVY